MGKDDLPRLSIEDRAYIDALRSFGTAEQVGEFHKKLAKIVDHKESRTRVYGEIFRVFIALGGIGGVILTLKAVYLILVPPLN